MYSLGKCVVTGAAGFIGSNLCDYLLGRGHEVIGLDNLSTGRREFLKDALKSPKFTLVEVDLFDAVAAERAIRDSRADTLIHLAAHADVRFGCNQPRRDLEQGTIVTLNVLEGVRLGGISTVVLASTGSVYGEPNVFPTPESCPFPVQTSLYGAAKLAAEGLVQAYVSGFGIRAVIYRFVSILGERYSHGHVRDFVAKLLFNPNEIDVLGDGSQTKSYLYVGDCVAGIVEGIERSEDRLSIFNLGTDDYVTVNQSLDLICAELGVVPNRKYSGGSRGWVGDSPFIFLDCAKIRTLGWAPKRSISEGIQATVRYLLENRWLLERGEN